MERLGRKPTKQSCNDCKNTKEVKINSMNIRCDEKKCGSYGKIMKPGDGKICMFFK